MVAISLLYSDHEVTKSTKTHEENSCTRDPSCVFVNFVSSWFLYRAAAHVAADFRRARRGRARAVALHGREPARHRHTAGAHHLHHAVGPQHFDQAVDLVLRAGGLDDERLGADIDDARAVDVDELHDVRPRLARGGHLDEREIP